MTTFRATVRYIPSPYAAYTIGDLGKTLTSRIGIGHKGLVRTIIMVIIDARATMRSREILLSQGWERGYGGSRAGEIHHRNCRCTQQFGFFYGLPFPAFRPLHTVINLLTQMNTSTL